MLLLTLGELGVEHVEGLAALALLRATAKGGP